MLLHLLHLCLLQKHFAIQKFTRMHAHTHTHAHIHTHTHSYMCKEGDLFQWVPGQQRKACEQLLVGAYTRKIYIYLYCTGMYESRPWLIRSSGHEHLEGRRVSVLLFWREIWDVDGLKWLSGTWGGKDDWEGERSPGLKMDGGAAGGWTQTGKEVMDDSRINPPPLPSVFTLKISTGPDPKLNLRITSPSYPAPKRPYIFTWSSKDVLLLLSRDSLGWIKMKL